TLSARSPAPAAEFAVPDLHRWRGGQGVAHVSIRGHCRPRCLEPTTMSATVERTFHLAHVRGLRGGCRKVLRSGMEEPSSGEAPEESGPAHRVHPLARRMALAIRCQQLIDGGVAADQATLAEVTGMTRAWITVIMRLTLLAPDLQEWLLHL